MSTVIARALTMIAVVFQSYFNWDPGTSSDGNVKHGRSITGDGGTAYHLAGLVLARGGSKGIPKKNLVEVNGRALVGRALDAMIESGVFTTIWVSTDDPDISKWVTNQYSRGEGRKVEIHKRAAYTATDSASSMSAVLEFLSFHPEVDAIGLVQATSPFLQPEYLQQAASKLLHKSSPSHDSVFSVTRSHHLRWTVEDAVPHTFSLSNKKATLGTKPINFSPQNRPRRQDWSGEMVENGMFYFAFRNILTDYHTFQSDRSSYVEIPKHLSMEIDTLEDLEMARCLASRIDDENTQLKIDSDPLFQSKRIQRIQMQDKHPTKGEKALSQKGQLKEL